MPRSFPAGVWGVEKMAEEEIVIDVNFMFFASP